MNSCKPGIKRPGIMPGAGDFASAASPTILRNNFDGEYVRHIVTFEFDEFCNFKTTVRFKKNPQAELRSAWGFTFSPRF
jgi:hypothetical protein